MNGNWKLINIKYKKHPEHGHDVIDKRTGKVLCNVAYAKTGYRCFDKWYVVDKNINLEDRDKDSLVVAFLRSKKILKNFMEQCK